MTLEPPPGATTAQYSLIDSLLARYGRERRGEPLAVADSVLNENYRVETDGGPRFVRIHNPRRVRERLEEEQRLTRWVGARGIPVALPLADSSGRALHRLGGRFASLFPWIEGTTLRRGQVLPEQAAQLGGMHGRVTALLRGFESPWIAANRHYPHWDTEASIAALTRVDDLIRYYPSPGEWQLGVQRRLRFQLELLESPAARPLSDFAALPRQVCHGDFHERQVIFDGERIAAVVDWEAACVAPPAWELLRALTLSGLLEPELARAYTRAYREQMPAGQRDLALAVECWWQTVLHDTWSLTTRFIQGDARPERFFASEEETLRRFADAGYRERLLEMLAQ